MTRRQRYLIIDYSHEYALIGWESTLTVLLAQYSADVIVKRETSRINFRELYPTPLVLSPRLDGNFFLFPRAARVARTSQTRTWRVPLIPQSQLRSALASFLLVSQPPLLSPREICPGLWEGRPRLRVSFVEVNVFNFTEDAPLLRKPSDERKEKGNDDNAMRRALRRRLQLRLQRRRRRRRRPNSSAVCAGPACLVV